MNRCYARPPSNFGSLINLINDNGRKKNLPAPFWISHHYMWENCSNRCCCVPEKIWEMAHHLERNRTSGVECQDSQSDSPNHPQSGEGTRGGKRMGMFIYPKSHNFVCMANTNKQTSKRKLHKYNRVGVKLGMSSRLSENVDFCLWCKTFNYPYSTLFLTKSESILFMCT